MLVTFPCPETATMRTRGTARDDAMSTVAAPTTITLSNRTRINRTIVTVRHRHTSWPHTGGSPELRLSRLLGRDLRLTRTVSPAGA
jgi:hypothetical protein